MVTGLVPGLALLRIGAARDASVDRTSCRAAWTSSSRPVGVTWGVDRNSSGAERSPLTIACMAPMHEGNFGMLLRLWLPAPAPCADGLCRRASAGR
jgi:hypothetical protein